MFAGFTFDGAAQVAIQEDPDPHLRIHLTHIRLDVNMGGLLKDTPGSQLFTVFGLPRVRLIPLEEPEKPYSGTFTVRISPELHRDIALRARMTGKCLNGWVTDLLGEAVARPDPVAQHPSSGPIGRAVPTLP